MTDAVVILYTDPFLFVTSTVLDLRQLCVVKVKKTVYFCISLNLISHHTYPIMIIFFNIHTCIYTIMIIFNILFFSPYMYIHNHVQTLPNIQDVAAFRLKVSVSVICDRGNLKDAALLAVVE